MNLLPSIVRRRLDAHPELAKIVHNIVWLFADKFLRLGIGLVVGLWLARYLGPGQFGRLNYAIAFVALFGEVAALGLPPIIVRNLVRDPETTDQTIGTAALLQLLGGILAFATTSAAIWLLRPEDETVRAATIILAMGMLFNPFGVSQYWFEAKVLSKYYVWISNGTSYALAAVKLVLIMHHAPLLSFAWATLADGALTAIGAALLFSRKVMPWRRLKASTACARAMLLDSWSLLLSGLTISVYMKIDVVMLGRMKGDATVGIYSAATKVSEIWYFVPMGIVASVFPAILRAKQESEALFYARLQRLFDAMAILAMAVAIPMTFASEFIIALLFGAPFAGAAPILALHVWVAVVSFLGVAGGKWFVIENRQIINLQRTSAGAVANILLNLVLIPPLSGLGAAIATLISYSVSDLFYDLVHAETRVLFRMKLRAIMLNGLRSLVLPPDNPEKSEARH